MKYIVKTKQELGGRGYKYYAYAYRTWFHLLLGLWTWYEGSDTSTAEAKVRLIEFLKKDEKRKAEAKKIDKEKVLYQL